MRSENEKKRRKRRARGAVGPLKGGADDSMYMYLLQPGTKTSPATAPPH
jgi:hypothetical protein